MAESKKTIAQFIDEYEAYLNSIQGSVARVEKERKQWTKEQKLLEEQWNPVVARLVASHSEDAWWSALEKTIDPQLSAIRTNAQKTIADMALNQQFAKNKIQECTSFNHTLVTKLVEADAMLVQAREQRDSATAALDAAYRARSEFHDNMLDAMMRKWKNQSKDSRSALYYDHRAPQPWWAKDWILSAINPEMAANKREAAHFEERTGKNLFAAAQGYAVRLSTWRQTEEAWRAAELSYKRVEQAHATLEEAKRTNDKEIKRGVEWLLPETGAQSLSAQTQHVRATAVEVAAKHCIVHGITDIGDVQLKLPNTNDHAALVGKLDAFEHVNGLLKKATHEWRVGEHAVEGALGQLNHLAQKHGRHSKVGVDTETTQTMARDIEQASVRIHNQFKTLRPVMSQPTPFADSAGFLTSTTPMYPAPTSTFWAMAWMHLLNTQSCQAHEPSPQGGESYQRTGMSLLDPVQFSMDFQDAHGGLGLGMDLDTSWSLGVDTSSVGVNTSSGGGKSMDNSSVWGGVAVDVADIRIDTTSIGSSSESYSVSHTQSHASTHSHSDTTTTATSDSPGGSCGASCGGGVSAD